MPGEIPTGEIHHLRLTVTDLERSRQFYTSLLGFTVAVESPPEDDPSAAEVFKGYIGTTTSEDPIGDDELDDEIPF